MRRATVLSRRRLAASDSCLRFRDNEGIRTNSDSIRSTGLDTVASLLISDPKLFFAEYRFLGKTRVYDETDVGRPGLTRGYKLAEYMDGGGMEAAVAPAKRQKNCRKLMAKGSA